MRVPRLLQRMKEGVPLFVLFFCFCLGHASISDVQAQLTDDHGTKNEVKVENNVAGSSGVVSDSTVLNHFYDRVKKGRDEAIGTRNDPNASPEEKQNAQGLISAIDEFPRPGTETAKQKETLLNMLKNSSDQTVNAETKQIEGTRERTGLRGTDEETVEKVTLTDEGAKAANNAVGISDSPNKTQNAIVSPANQPAVVAGLAAFAQAKVSPPTPQAGTVSTNSDSNFGNTLGSTRSAGSAASGGSRSGIDVGDVGKFVDRARDTLGVPREGFDLSGNPFYSPSAGAEIRSVFKDFALGSGFDGDANFLDEQSKLNKLVTTPGFQDFSKNAIGVQGTNDLNLLAAGAAIAADPSIPDAALDLSKDYIFKNLSTNEIISSNPVLASLDQGLGVGSLAQLGPQTLEWLALAGNLAFGEKSKLPKGFQGKQEEYKAAFLELKSWLEGLRSINALSELDGLKIPMDPLMVNAGWKYNFEKLQNTHLVSAKTIESSKRFEKYQKKTAKMIRTVSNWLDGATVNDAEKLALWQKNVYQPTKFSRAWASADPIAVGNAKFYFGKAYYFSTLTKFLPDSQSKLKTLVADAQVWGVEIRKQLKRRDSLAKAKALAQQSAGN